MKHVKNYKLFLEENTQTYLKNVSNKAKPKPGQSQTPTDEVDTILQSTEDQKGKIIAKKDAIEKGLLKNIKELEPENQEDVKTSVKEFGDQVKEFDKTVKQIKNLDKTLKTVKPPQPYKSQMTKAREQNNL